MLTKRAELQLCRLRTGVRGTCFYPCQKSMFYHASILHSIQQYVLSIGGYKFVRKEKITSKIVERLCIIDEQKKFYKHCIDSLRL